jgi:uncharacterized linocin/CFP29 family protein
MNNGRHALAWPDELWSRIDQAVHAQVDRVGIAGKFLPLWGPVPDATTVPADVIDPETMTVPGDAVLPLVELSVEFGLTETQVDGEAQLGTAVTLATRSASLLAQAEDLLVLQGDKAADHPIFQRVQRRGTAGTGLVAAAAASVDVAPNGDGRAGERTLEAVARATAALQAKNHAGPYALVLRTEQYADAFEPLANTLVTPADRLRPLMAQGLFATASLPERTGLVVSLGGDTVDLVVGVEPSVAFLQTDAAGLFHFRASERLALRLKDPEALIRLNFEH